MSAIAAVLFGVVTVIVIVCQVRVMKAQTRVLRFQAKLIRWQARQSARLQQTQNTLIRLQHEHEWLRQKNEERNQLLLLTRRLGVAAEYLREKPSSRDGLHWTEVKETAFELSRRFNALDVAVILGPHDEWNGRLKGYVDAILKAIFDDSKFEERHGIEGGTPVATTRQTLREAQQRFDLTSTLLSLEGAIRMDSFDFMRKWDDVFKPTH